MKKSVRILSLILVLTAANTLYPGFWLDLESGAALPGYNDVRIPSSTGTLFSLKNDIKSNGTFFYRIKTGFEFLERHNVFILFAPLTLKGESILQKNITYQDKTYLTGSLVHSSYTFNSYRLSYAYKLFNTDTFKFALGFSAKIRDAEISLSDSSQSSSRSNIGVVPLIHLDLQYFIVPGQFSLQLAGDGLAAPQGRAEDFMAVLNYYFNPNFSMRIGYRLLEGGSDGGGSVYNFTMIHYLILGAQYQF
jgi:hypothetical protein